MMGSRHIERDSQKDVDSTDDSDMYVMTHIAALVSGPSTEFWRGKRRRKKKREWEINCAKKPLDR